MKYAILLELILAACAYAAPPKAPPVGPPKAPAVACVCGVGCKCAPDACPGSCPVAPQVWVEEWHPQYGKIQVLRDATAAGKVVSRPATPKAPGAWSTTPTIGVTGAGNPSSPSIGFYPAVPTYTFAPGAVMRGNTSACPPSG